MDLFAKFKENLKQSLSGLKKRGDPSRELFDAVEAADNWETLKEHLAKLRALSRRRQQEVLERLEPLAERVEGLLAQAKEMKIKVMKQNLLRQAQGYMRELEAEDEPARIHSANCEMLTNIVKQVERARAMSERGIDEEAVDAIATRLEEIVVTHEATMEAAGELEAAGRITTPGEVSMDALQARLSAVYDTGKADEDETGPAAATREQIGDIEKELYEE